MVELAQDNIRCLRQGMDLLRQLTADSYASKESRCFGSTIGGHMRHNIDHYYSFVKGYADGKVDYDARLRDERVETDPAVAIEQMDELATALEAIQEETLSSDVEVIMDSGNEAAGCAPSRSTVRRELQFLLSHTIHHYALIAVICQLRGIEPSAEFGVAPSTLRHRKSSSCAQ
ncbi:MAG: DinB family protein [Verrucomicrobiota bacterium]